MLKAVVRDIKGAISSIYFVKEVLFPYSVDSIPGFVEQWSVEFKVRAHSSKAIQGNIWEIGCRKESFKAQKLFFSYSEFGGITDLLSECFDTNIGSKRIPNSCAKNAKQISLKLQSILLNRKV